MTTTRSSARVFIGSEIRPAIQAAVAAMPHSEISEFYAGENMQIVVVYPVYSLNGEGERDTIIGFNTDAWDGEQWITIQWD